jgi:hypothetical protein
MANRLDDLTGRRFGQLTVLQRSDPPIRFGKTYWQVRCDCGNEKDLRASDLKSGRQKGCGCMRTKNSPFSGDITGMRVGRLVALYVVSKRGKDKKRHRYWMMRCDCGVEQLVPTSSLSRGYARSCGCLRAEVAREMAFKRKRSPNGRGKWIKEHATS